MSAIVDTPADKAGPIQVLFLLHEGFDTLDFAGPMEAFSYTKSEEKPGTYCR